MAIDTALKRKSATTTSVSWGPASVTPDAAEPVAWRKAAGWSYHLTAAPAGTPAPGGAAKDVYYWTVKRDRYEWVVKRDRIEA